MKVIYKRTIIDKLMEKIHDAERHQRKIDYILLSYAEMDELMDDPYMRHACFMAYRYDSVDASTTAVKTITLYDQRTGRPFRVAHRGYNFHGFDLYAVPPEFAGA